MQISIFDVLAEPDSGQVPVLQQEPEPEMPKLTREAVRCLRGVLMARTSGRVPEFLESVEGWEEISGFRENYKGIMLKSPKGNLELIQMSEGTTEHYSIRMVHDGLDYQYAARTDRDIAQLTCKLVTSVLDNLDHLEEEAKKEVKRAKRRAARARRAAAQQ